MSNEEQYWRESLLNFQKKKAEKSFSAACQSFKIACPQPYKNEIFQIIH
jgi:hypothetical protein